MKTGITSKRVAELETLISELQFEIQRQRHLIAEIQDTLAPKGLPYHYSPSQVDKPFAQKCSEAQENLNS